MGKTGALIRTYGKSRSFLAVWWGLAAIFAMPGAFLLWLTTAIKAGGIRFDGDISILYATGFGAIALGAIVAIGAWWLASSQPTFHLHENAIRAVGRHGDRTDFYEDIEDIYCFFLGGFSYRASPGAPWIFAGSRISRGAELRRRLTALHAEKRGQRLYRELLAGKTVAFRCLPDNIALSKSFVASSNMDYPTFNLELTQTHLKIGNKAIRIRDLADIRTNLWTERSQILDVNGKVFHTMHPTAIMSFEVLFALLQELQHRERAYGDA
jgi:hypothetical protein